MFCCLWHLISDFGDYYEVVFYTFKMDGRPEIWSKYVKFLLYYIYYIVLEVALYRFISCKYIILVIFIICANFVHQIFSN